MPQAASNRLLNALPADYRATLLDRMEKVSLYVPATQYRPGETPKFAHFMVSGITSIVLFMQDGRGVELGIVGSEGLVESLHLQGDACFPSTGFLQIEGTALRMPFTELQSEFQRSQILRDRVMEYNQAQALIGHQLVGCNRLHEVEERLARWLLTIADRLGEERFVLTQEFLAQMLGTQRTTVTLAAGRLQNSGLIEYRRGDIKILDRESLESAACECYPVVRNLVSGLYSEARRPGDIQPRHASA